MPFPRISVPEYVLHPLKYSNFAYQVARGGKAVWGYRGTGVWGRDPGVFTPSLPYAHTPLLVFSLNLLKGPDDGVHARILIDVMDVDVTDNPFLVDNKNSSFSDTLRPENVVFK